MDWWIIRGQGQLIYNRRGWYRIKTADLGLCEHSFAIAKLLVVART